MSNSKNNGFFDYDWKNFEQFFGGRLPPHAGQAGAVGGDMAWVDNYVKDVMKKAMPQMEVQSLKHHFHCEVFDTHNNVVVKIHIPDRNQARKVSVQLSINQIRLRGLPDDNTQIIRLNAVVIPTSCKAVYKQGILQLYIRKQQAENPFYDVDVRFN